MSTETETLSITLGILEGLALAVSRDRNRYALNVISLTGTDKGYATDGKRLHATVDALDVPRVAACVDVRALEALVSLADPSSKLERIEIEGEHARPRLMCRGVIIEHDCRCDVVPPDAVQAVIKSARKNPDVATVKSWKGARAKFGKKGERKGETVARIASLAEKARIFLNDSAVLELDWLGEGETMTPDQKEGTWINPTFLRDAATWVGDGATVKLPKRGGSAVYLESSDGSRIALIMPINVQ